MISWDDLTEEQKLLCAGIDPERAEDGPHGQARLRLPGRRTCDTIEVDHIWSPATSQEIVEPLLLSIGRHEDGRIGEVFIDGREIGRGKVAQRTTALRQDVAVLISIALQYGAPIEVLRGAVSRAELNVMGKARIVPQTIVGTVLDALAGEQG